MKSERKEQKRDNRIRRWSRFSLTMLYAAFTFLVLALSLAISLLCVKIFIRYDVLMHIPGELIPSMNSVLLFMLSISLIVGALLALPVVQLQLFPLNRLITQMNRLASGDFKARLHYGKVVSIQPSYAEIESSFNKMAEELESTELLRSDFVNNFSHEFKTPIVSIAGFARILQRGGLTEEQNKEYLSAITEESLRLSNMATNVLNLTRLENQTILSDVSSFNLSEQLRSCVLLLENAWSEKELDWVMEADEYEIEANEEQLKEVWINLLDNAIKFSDAGGSVSVEIREEKESLSVTIANPGEIAPEALPKIWHKFYQGDESHSTAGNGIGLAIVRRITELHQGSVACENRDGRVYMTVMLPKTQKIGKRR